MGRYWPYIILFRRMAIDHKYQYEHQYFFNGTHHTALQNKDTTTMQIKLNELLAANKNASNRVVNIKDLSEPLRRIPIWKG